MPNERQDDDGLAPDAVGEPPEQRAQTSWATEKAANEQPDGGRRGAEALGVEPEDRDDDPEADEVEGDRRPDRPEAGGSGAAALGDAPVAHDVIASSSSGGRWCPAWCVSTTQPAA